MAKNNDFMRRIALEMDRREAAARHFARVFQMDLVTLALGRMGWGEKRFAQLDKMLTEVATEHCANILEDAKTDKECWYSKDTLDRELARYVGKLFVPYEERYR